MVDTESNNVSGWQDEITMILQDFYFSIFTRPHSGLGIVECYKHLRVTLFIIIQAEVLGHIIIRGDWNITVGCLCRQSL